MSSAPALLLLLTLTILIGTGRTALGGGPLGFSAYDERTTARALLYRPLLKVVHLVPKGHRSPLASSPVLHTHLEAAKQAMPVPQARGSADVRSKHALMQCMALHSVFIISIIAQQPQNLAPQCFLTAAAAATAARETQQGKRSRFCHRLAIAWHYLAKR